jgi:hypothetical protein
MCQASLMPLQQVRTTRSSTSPPRPHRKPRLASSRDHRLSSFRRAKGSARRRAPGGHRVCSIRRDHMYVQAPTRFCTTLHQLPAQRAGARSNHIADLHPEDPPSTISSAVLGGSCKLDVLRQAPLET